MESAIAGITVAARAVAVPLRGPNGVDAINTFGVSAGHFASFGVVSLSQIPRFRSRQLH
jgi:hypothetical protein